MKAYRRLATYRRFIQSAMRSAIIKVVALVLARMQLGMIDASTTRRPSNPRTRPRWSTTAIGSESGSILQAPEMCCEVETFPSSHWSSASSEFRSASVGSIQLSTIPR